METKEVKKTEKKEKKSIGQKFKDLKTSVGKKVNAFKEKHPTAYKVIGGVVIVAGAAGVGAAAYAVGKNRAESNSVEVPVLTDGSVTPVDTSSAVDSWEQKRREEDLKDWEANKENWQKVMEVADNISLNDKNDLTDEYLIHGDNDGNVVVAHVTDGDYHYPPETFEQNTDEGDQEVEG